MDTDEKIIGVERVRLELATRKLMVMMLALIATWVGIAMMLTGAPNFVEAWFSPWSRYVAGGFAFGAGVVTALAGLAGDRTRCGWWVQVLGLAALVLWYAALGVAYVGLLAQQGLPLVGAGEPLPDGVTGRGYVPLVYGGLSLMTAIPLVTMIRLGRPRKA